MVILLVILIVVISWLKVAFFVIDDGEITGHSLELYISYMGLIQYL